MKGFVVAGTGSDVGKTVVTLSVIRALRDRGYDVQPYKVGPDYIDPSHHEAVAGKPSRNLDPFLMGRDGLIRNFHRGEGEIGVVEGVMGMYDGGENSTAAVAKILDLPVVLVLDGSATAESAGAVAHGFASYGGVKVAGAVANRAGSSRHERMLRDALSGYRYVAVLPRTEGAEIPGRHLGLRMSGERTIHAAALDKLASHVDAAALAEIAEPAVPEPGRERRGPVEDRGTRVGVALDEAFNFYYRSNVEHLGRAAELVFFSPLRGDLPDVDAVYLGGGYPELHAERLSGSGTLRYLRDGANDGMPIYGECGGMMALGESLTAESSHEMAGILPIDFEMRDDLQAVGYVEATTRSNPFTGRGRTVRGHEFHYSSCELGGVDAAYDLTRGEGVDGSDGFHEHNALGAYTHVHAGSAGFLLDGLVEAGADYRRS
ncbi:MAG: Cobyrinate a,c-diamide synthase [Methanonatronarchaeales archaeon]|nr:Cobyrinate a,c-diamide synthase [Methanonatronarchaeales archaeon]